MPKYKSFGAFGVIISTVFRLIYKPCLHTCFMDIFYVQVLLVGAQSYKISAIKIRV